MMTSFARKAAAAALLLAVLCVMVSQATAEQTAATPAGPFRRLLNFGHGLAIGGGGAYATSYTGNRPYYGNRYDPYYNRYDPYYDRGYGGYRGSRRYRDRGFYGRKLLTA